MAGLYQIDTYIIASGNNIYVLSGSYHDKTSAIYNDFQELVKSFTFTPQSSALPQGRINPQVMCESALAYTTFPSSTEADLFIEECAAGKHPEVFDRYIKDNNLDRTVI